VVLSAAAEIEMFRKVHEPLQSPSVSSAIKQLQVDSKRQAGEVGRDHIFS
jgi:hypothetical protein